MSENIAAQFKQDGEPAFPIVENDEQTSSESPAETNNTEETQSVEGENSNESKDDGEQKGFSDHPRWKEREQDWKERFNEQETRHADSIKGLREEFDGKIEKNVSHETNEVPEWFGGDADAWKSFESYQKNQITNAQNKAQKEVLEQNTSQQKLIDDATKFMNDEIASIESTGEKIDKNALLKFVIDNELVDTRGRWNYKAGHKMMRAGKTTKNSDLTQKKNLANAVLDDNGEGEVDTKYTTSEDFENPSERPW